MSAIASNLAAVPLHTVPDREPVERQSALDGIGWVLFFLVNAALFLRPEEFVSSLTGASLYQWLILACLVANLPRIGRQLRKEVLVRQPITVCVLGLLAAVLLSHLWHFRIGDAVRGGFTFGKVVVYYLLLVSVVDSPARLRQFMVWIAGFALVLTLISVLCYHQVITVPAVRTDPDIDPQQIDEKTGLPVVIQRLQSVGIFDNPNDFARILVIGILICLFEAWRRPVRTSNLFWLGALGLMAYALRLTYSRGGLLALAAGVVSLFYARFGWKKTIAVSVLVLPAAAMFFAGRQTDFDVSQGTAQQRLHIWSDGLMLLHDSPLFGIGMDQYGIILGPVAHNSFVQGYVELGLFGGILFTGAFYLAIVGLIQLGSHGRHVADSELWRLRASLLAIITGYAVGLLSSTRNYTELTYVLLGLVAAYLWITPIDPPVPLTRFDRSTVRKVAIVGVAVLIAFSLYVRFAAQYGVGE